MTARLRFLSSEQVVALHEAAMLTFLQANGGRARVSDERLATLMIELQRRAEAGEDVARLVHWIARELVARPTASRRRRT